MSIFPKKISWTEPWDWGVRKERIRQIYKGLPPLWRIGVYCLIGFGVFVATRIVYPETQESLTWGRIIITSATAFLAFGVIFGSSCMTVGGFPLHKFAWPLFYGLLSRSSGPRNFD